MPKVVRQSGKVLLYLLPLAVLVFLLATAPDKAAGATYTDPFWTNNASSPECVACYGCGCPRPPEWSPNGVSYRTGELSRAFALFTIPTRTGSRSFGFRWRSEISGSTQLGKSVLPDWEHTLEVNILNPGDPNGNGGHEVIWRTPEGLEITFDYDGSAYSTQDCAVHTDLSVNGSGQYVLTTKYQHEYLFDTNGMLDTETDRNGNVFDYTYNGSYQLTALTDDRGKSFSIGHNTDGFMSYLEDPAGRRWNFTYDTSGNLIRYKTPTTADQASGIEVELDFDTSNRLIDITDGRGNNVHGFDWVSSTRQIDKVTICSTASIDFIFNSGVTTVTDPEGNSRRYHHSGQDITKTDMWINSVAKYATTYTYNGADVVTVVLPRGNRIDYTYDASSNITEKRRKLTNTSSNSASDIVESWAYNTSNFKTSYTDGEGEETTYTVDSGGNVTKITYPTVTSPVTQTAATKEFQFNSYGQLTQVTDEEGKVTKRTYFATGTSVGLLEKIEVDPTGLDLETTYAYDSAGNVTSRTDPNGGAWTYTYDNLRRMTKQTAPSPLSYETKWNYDGNGNVTKKEVENIDEDGDAYTGNPWITTTYTYCDCDCVLTVVEEIDASTTRTTTFAYNDNDQRIRVTRPEGNKDKWTYNERGLVATHVRGETATEASTTSYQHDDNGNLTDVDDGENNTTSHTYDLFDRRTKTTTALDHYTEYTFDKNGQVTEESRKDSSDTELANRAWYFDERGRLWKIADMRDDPSATSLSDAVTEIERYKTGHVKVVTDADGNDTTISYDAAWRRTGVEDPLGNETTWTLDDNGNATAWSIEEVDGASTVTHEYEATYDALNRRLTTVEIDRTDSNNELTITSGFDSRGNLVWQENAEGNPTRWTFDAAGRMTKKEVALSTGTTIEDFTAAVVTEWGFDKNDRLDSHKDDAGNETTWDHDALDRVTKMTYPDNKTVQYEFDDADNVTKTTDAAGNVIDDTFNAGNQRTSRTVTKATGFIDTTSESWTYDGLGRMTKAQDNDYKVEFTYAVQGFQSMVYEEKQSIIGGSALTKTVTKTYDIMGRKETELYPSTTDLDYTWTDIGLLDTVSDGTNTIADYTYVGNRVKEVEFENGATASYTFTGFRSEVERIHHETSTPATIVDLQYAYDKNHDRLYERFGGATASGDAFEYDWARRLDVAWMGSTQPSSPSTAAYTKKIEYTLDDNGNRSSVKVTPYGQSATTTSYTDNNLNQYTDVGGTTHSYDANGNLTDDGQYTYEYNFRNLLCRVKEGATVVASYQHDALGRRVKTIIGSACKRYIYSGAETIAVYDESNALLQEFVYGQVIDEVLMLEQADVLDADGDSNTTELARSFYHRNALGSIMEITEMDEDVAVSYRYDPYGAVTITRNGSTQSSDPLGQPITYTGRWSDEETGLMYYRARMYSARVGRFLQRDPLGVKAGPNLFEYSASRPSVMVDSFGLKESRAPVPKAAPPSVRAAAWGAAILLGLRNFVGWWAEMSERMEVARSTVPDPHLLELRQQIQEHGYPWWPPEPPEPPPDGPWGRCWCKLTWGTLIHGEVPEPINLPIDWRWEGPYMTCSNDAACESPCEALARAWTSKAKEILERYRESGADPNTASLYFPSGGSVRIGWDPGFSVSDGGPGNAYSCSVGMPKH